MIQDDRAYAQRAGNPYWISVENEVFSKENKGGCILTPSQIDNLVGLLFRLYNEEEFLRDGGSAEKLFLTDLSNELNIHPLHPSRDFPRYFSYTFGEYARKIRVEKSLSFLPDKNPSLPEFAFECGFADQRSHFLRGLKEIIGINPFSAYRKLFAGKC